MVTIPLLGDQRVYEQQQEMYQSKSRRCDDGIVCISQPHVCPIIRGKLDKLAEFGAKLSVSLNGDGLVCVNHLRWDAFHEGHDLESQIEAYRVLYGVYPEMVLGDPIYGTRENRRYLNGKGVGYFFYSGSVSTFGVRNEWLVYFSF